MVTIKLLNNNKLSNIAKNNNVSLRKISLENKAC